MSETNGKDFTRTETATKPFIDTAKRFISQVEADARLTAEQKAEIFGVFEGLVAYPRIKWRQIADKKKGGTSETTGPKN